jgi:two-component sensor histidine kinase
MTTDAAIPDDRIGGIRVLIDSGAEALPELIDEVRRTLHGWDMADRADDAALVVDELVLNATRHVGGELIVQLLPLDAGFRVEVADRDPDFRIHASLPSPERYGLKIVDASCDRWGVAPVVGAESGKVVWAEFDSGAPGGASSAGSVAG